MDLSVIIVNYNVYEDVKLCIENIYKNLKNISYEIIVVDNNSESRDIENLNTLFPEVKLLLLDNNYGFSYANNIGMKLSKGKCILLLNPDIIINDDSINILYSELIKYSKTAVTGPVQIKPNEGIEYYYTFFPSVYSRFMQEFGMYMKAKLMKKRIYNFLDENIKAGKPFKVDWVMGSCMMFKREIFDITNGFNEAFFLFEEETEWQYRISKLGYEIYMIPDAKVIHNHHSSTSKIGKMFVLFQEYRSRIIFDLTRNDIVFNLIRRLILLISITFRFIVFTIINYVSFDILRKRIILYSKLLMLVLLPKLKLIKNRFIYKDNIKYFFNTGNAKF